MEFSIDEDIGKRYCHVTVSSSLSNFFDACQIHPYVNELTIFGYSGVADLNAINQDFPSIRRLNVNKATSCMSPNEIAHVNRGLKELTLPWLCMHQHDLDRLHGLYPNLNSLTVASSSWDIPQTDLDRENSVCKLEMPWKKLREIQMGSVSAPPFVKHLMIGRLKRDLVVSRWIYNTTSHELVQTKETCKLQNSIELVEKPLILLKSNSLNSVELQI